MKRTVYIVLIVMWGVGRTASAQQLYEISGNGCRQKSYLLATNRLVDITFLDSIPRLWKAYGACDKVLTEFAFEDYQAIQTLREAALLPDSVVLRDYYTADEYERIDKSLYGTLNMGMESLCRMKPSYLTALYRDELLRKWLHYDEQWSMETFFEQAAQVAGIPVYGLDELGETMYMQFDREPFPHQVDELIQIVDYPEREVAIERSLMESYRRGLLTDMAYEIEGPNNTSTIAYSDYQVFAQRNKEWAKRLSPYLVEGKNFITLNAIYLGGDKGLIHCLREAGYKVKAIIK